jgi:hypothetical protein
MEKDCSTCLCWHEESPKWCSHPTKNSICISFNLWKSKVIKVYFHYVDISTLTTHLRNKQSMAQVQKTIRLTLSDNQETVITIRKEDDSDVIIIESPTSTIKIPSSDVNEFVDAVNEIDEA